MYLGYTRPVEWPLRAGLEDFKRWACMPAWHVEEATALVCGLVPRRDVRFFPLDPDPGTSPSATEPLPYPDAKSWNEWLHGPMGTVLSLFARHVRVHIWDFTEQTMYVAPREFVDFCDATNISVPPDLRTALAAASGSWQPEPTSRDACAKHPYQELMLRTAAELAERAAGHSGLLTVPQFQAIVESRDDAPGLGVDPRTVETYLRFLRKESAVAEVLKQILRSAKGKQSETEKHAVASWLTDAELKTLGLSRYRCK